MTMGAGSGGGAACCFFRPRPLLDFLELPPPPLELVAAAAAAAALSFLASELEAALGLDSRLLLEEDEETSALEGTVWRKNTSCF